MNAVGLEEFFAFFVGIFATMRAYRALADGPDVRSRSDLVWGIIDLVVWIAIAAFAWSFLRP